ncbi:MAG: putative DNA binding domain-containing protein [Acidobacteria bacterium]|nr:putative DNA binding domain-containing protein [Acidobacteriota bacterium]
MSESQNVEWKRRWRDEYLRWICGFANAEGGVLVIGRDDDGQVVGLSQVRRLLEDIPNKVRDVLGIVVDVNLRAGAGKEYLAVVVEPQAHPVSYKGEYHYRSGSTRQELKGAALSRFLLRKQGLHWDGVPVPHARLEDLSEAAVDRFREEARRSGRLDAALLAEPTPALVDRLHLRERSHLKRAALLLFHPDPEVFFTGAYVKIGFFRDNVDLLYHDEIHGDLFAQVARTIDLLSTKYLRAGIRYEGIRRVESFPVPGNALREAVLNAVVHKDYASGATVQISVYDDKLMIWNPGQLPPDWKAEDLLEKHESKPFNPDVAHAFFRAGLVEAWGRGIDLILADCRQAGVPEPELRFKRGGFWAVFRFPADYPVPTGAPRIDGEPADLAEPAEKPAEEPAGRAALAGHPVLFTDLNARASRAAARSTTQEIGITTQKTGATTQEGRAATRKRILDLLRTEPAISRRVMAERIGITPDGIKYHLTRLRAAGVVRHVGPANGGRWEVLE